MPPQSSGITLSRCEKCGYEASTAYLVRGKCEPCRSWLDTYGPQVAGADTKNKAKCVLPPKPKVTRYISVRKALARAKATYGHIPRFIVTIIRQNTKRSGKMESFPVCKLPVKLHADRGKRNPVISRNR